MDKHLESTKKIPKRNERPRHIQFYQHGQFKMTVKKVTHKNDTHNTTRSRLKLHSSLSKQLINIHLWLF